MHLQHRPGQASSRSAPIRAGGIEGYQEARIGPSPNFCPKPSSLNDRLYYYEPLQMLGPSAGPAHKLELIVESIILVIPSSIYWHQSVAHSTPAQATK